MSWKTPSPDDVLEEFTPQEKAALNTIQGGTTQLAGILTKTVDSARGSILAGGNDLDAAGTIPDQVLPDVLAIARWRWLISFPKLAALQTEARRDLYQDGMKALAKIADGHPKVERPANVAPSTGPIVTLPSVGTKHREFRKCQEDGI